MRMVQKASTGERFNHLVLLASFFILMWTGLGFLFAKLTWMNVVLGGTLLAKEIHKWSGIVFGVSLLITMGNYLGEALRWSAEDSEWLGGLGGYFSHKKMPEQGLLNAGQKLFYLVLLVFGLTIMVSGLLLWAGKTEGTTEDRPRAAQRRQHRPCDGHTDSHLPCLAVQPRHRPDNEPRHGSRLSGQGKSTQSGSGAWESTNNH